jgi:hypothetical protein
MTEIALPPSVEVSTIDPTGGRLVAWAHAASAAHQLATSLSRTTFVPKHFQGDPGAATAAILLADEIGLSPIIGLRSIYVISGTPALYARTMVALAVSHGHQVWTVESTDTKVTVSGQRAGSEHVETVTWTHERARKAGYTNNKKYDTDPQGMLYARASAEVARKVAPDVLAGVPHSREELEADEPEPTVRASRSVKRAERPATAEPALEIAAAPSEADLARTEVAAWAKAHGVDSRDLGDAHVAAHGRGLADEEDVDLIRAHMTEVAA